MKRLLMRYPLLIMATMAAMLFAACAADRSEPEATARGGMSGSWSTDPIAFGVSDSTAGDTIAPPPMLTRSPQNEGTLATVQTSGFGVFAARTGAHKYANSSISSNFMFNERIYYQSASWRYDLTKYWPNGEDGADEYISFFAYAPYNAGGGTTGVTDFSLPYEMGDPWLVFKLPPDPITNQIDLLYATKVDQQKSTNSGKVSFSFMHALACVGDKITTAVSEELGTLLQSEISGSLTQIEVKLRQITIDYTLTQKGRLTLGSTVRWQPVLSEAPTITRTVTIDHTVSPVTLATITSGGVSGNEVTDENNGVFYIPVQAGENAQKAAITLDYTITRTFSDASTTDYNGNTTTTIGLQAAGGEMAGEHLNLNINLSDNIRIKPMSLGSFYIQAPDQIYTGSALEPEVTVSNGLVVLTKDVDYTLTYSNNINAGIATVTATGMGNYDAESSISTTFLISPRHIKDVSVAAIPNETYDGTPKTPAVTVTNGTIPLVLGTDYNVTYSNNTNAGTADVTIAGIGNYTGSRIEHFTIGKVSSNLSISPTSLSWSGDEDLNSKTITATFVGDGTVSAVSDDTNIATTSVSSNTVTITPVGIGSTTITISISETTNYSASSQTCNIFINSSLTKLKTWVNGYSGDLPTSYYGYYVYADGNISSSNSGTAIGVVAYYSKTYVDANFADSRILVLALEDASVDCQWKTELTSDDTPTDQDALNGYNITTGRKDRAYPSGAYAFPAIHEAAYYSASLPLGASSWFLPAMKQWILMRSNIVNPVPTSYYWLSTGSDDYSVMAYYCTSATSGFYSNHMKNQSGRVRTCFAY